MFCNRKVARKKIIKESSKDLCNLQAKKFLKNKKEPLDQEALFCIFEIKNLMKIKLLNKS